MLIMSKLAPFSSTASVTSRHILHYSLLFTNFSRAVIGIVELKIF